MQNIAIGVDIGGTNTKVVAIDGSGQVLKQLAFPTIPGNPDAEAILANIIDWVGIFRGALNGPDIHVAGIGFAVPCYHDRADWTLRNVTNLPTLENYPMRAPLEKAFGAEIAMLNDVGAAGISEYLFGRGKDVDRMFFMAIGTGIASSFLTRERGLVCFSWDTIGDTGHIIVDPTGSSECMCGGRGCLESIASATAVRAEALRQIGLGKTTRLVELLETHREVSARDVAYAAAAGDETAREIMVRAGNAVGVALASYMHIFCPERIILGGGLSLAGDLLLQPARETVARLAGPFFRERLQGIETSTYGIEAGAVGSACLILHPEIIRSQPTE